MKVTKNVPIPKKLLAKIDKVQEMTFTSEKDLKRMKELRRILKPDTRNWLDFKLVNNICDKLTENI